MPIVTVEFDAWPEPGSALAAALQRADPGGRVAPADAAIVLQAALGLADADPTSMRVVVGPDEGGVVAPERDTAFARGSDSDEAAWDAPRGLDDGESFGETRRE